MKAGTNLEKVLEGGHFAVTAEVGPPKGTGTRAIQRRGGPAQNLHRCLERHRQPGSSSAHVQSCRLRPAQTDRC